MMEFSTEPLDILNYVLIGINITLALVILNWTICFSLLRDYPPIYARHPIIPICIGLYNTIFVGIDRSMVLIHSNLSQPFEYPGWVIVNGIFIQLWILTLYIIAWSAWIVYYEICWNKNLADEQWRLYINPAENNWFLKHKTKYGNPKLMIWPFIIPWFFTAAFYLYETGNENGWTSLSRYTLLAQAFIVMLFLVYIWYKMPKFDDIWRIRHELILTIRILVIGIAIFFVLGILLDWRPPSWKYSVLSTIGTGAAFFQCYSIIYYPLKRFKFPKCPCGAYVLSKSDVVKQRMELSCAQYRKKRSLGKESNVDDQPKYLSTQFFKLKAILLHPDGFRLFAAHLMKELAIENLLFFVETSQWLEYVMDICNKDPNNPSMKVSVDEKASGIDVKFHKHVPKSRIVAWNRHDDRPIHSLLTASLASSDYDGSVANDTGSAPGHTTPGPSGTISTTTKTHSSALGIMSSTQPKYSSARPKPGHGHSTQLTIDLNLDEFELGQAITDPWLQCVKIFQKYVINGSYFCINISGENRIELYDKFGYDTTSTKCDEELLEVLKEKCENNMDKLFHIFDTARYAVFRLMIYSVSRFENSDTYKEHFSPLDKEEE